MELGKPWIVLANAKGRVASTWYDDTQRHFVALLERSENPLPVTSTEDVCYQVFQIPSEEAPILETLVPNQPMMIKLPTLLANHENESPSRRRVPVLAKLSLDHTFLALQFTDTMIRIVPCSEKTITVHKQWTVDLSTGTSPTMVSVEDALAQNTSKVELGQKDTSILPGGIIWSEHGGNSQDLVVVTNHSVLCYKVSLQRKSMSATHAFSHPLAAAVWWEPCSRAILVGSYSTARATDLIMRAFFLHFSSTPSVTKLRPFRLELPPPDRIDPFPVGQFRTVSPVSVEDVVVINMYGDPYCVELGFFQNGMGVTFYHLDRKGAAVRAKTCLFARMSIPRACGKSTFVAVLDNVLCVHSRESSVSLFLDVMDLTGESEEGDCAGSIIEQKENGHTKVLRQKKVSFLSPSYILDIEGSGCLYPISLDIREVVSGANGNVSSVPFLLRRSNLEVTHQLVVDKIIQMIDDEAKMTSRQQTSVHESVALCRQTWIEEVATAYAVTSVYRCSEMASVSLMFKCALLPAGAEFNIDTADTCDVFQQYNEGALLLRPPVLTQTEIVERALLPLALHSLALSDMHLLVTVADVTLDVYSAFSARSCRPCPVLQCLLIALLWRLGKTQDVLAMVRASALLEQRSCFDSDHHNADVRLLGTPIQRDQHRLGVDNWAKIAIAIITSVPAGCGTDASVVSLGTDKMDVFSEELIEQVFASLSRLAPHEVVAKFLLSHGRLIGAMSVCLTVVHDQINKSEEASSSQSSSHVVVDGIRGEDFFHAAVDYATVNLSDVSDRVMLFFHLHAFLKVCDPQCLEVVDLISKPRVRRLSFGENPSKTHYRRPSAVASLVMETRAFRKENDCTINCCVRQSWLAHNTLYFPDSLFGGTKSTAAVKLRGLFGYSAAWPE